MAEILRRLLRLIHVFPYGRHILGRPFLVCDRQANGAEYSVFALVDSGADFCFFPLDIGLRLGFRPSGGGERLMRGITGSPTACYVWRVTLKFAFGSMDVEAGFSPDIEHAILGQNGFFDRVKVMFDRRKKLFTIEVNEL